MRVLGILAAWGVLAVLATLCFAVGGSIGYRRGVQDAVRQLRERRTGKTGCRPLPLPRQQRRPPTRVAVTVPRAVHVRAAAPPAVHRLRAYLSPPYLSPALVGAMAAVVLLAVPGVALGATGAQPGDALWPVKLRMERARVAVATGADSKMQVHVALASRRLTELNTLLNDDAADDQLVDTVIVDLRDHTEAASERLHEVTGGARGEVVASVEDVVERQVKVIDTLLDIDCGEGVRDATCDELDDSRVASVNLRDETVTVAAVSDTASGEAASATRPAPSQAPGAAASAKPSAPTVASAPPAGGAGPAPSPGAGVAGAAGVTGPVSGAAAAVPAKPSASPSPSASASSTPAAAAPAAAAPAGSGNDVDDTAPDDTADSAKAAKTAKTGESGATDAAGTAGTTAREPDAAPAP